MPGRVHATRDGAIATVVIDHQERLNALSTPMWRELGGHFRELSADDGVRCVVLRGAGDKAFAAGADIAAFETERYDVASAKQYAKGIHGTLAAIDNCPHPVIALIKGACVGGGLEVVSRCDMRICGQSSRFGIPVNRLGLVVAYEEMRALVDIAGPAAALEIVLEGRVFDAAEAFAKGLVNRVVSDGDVEKEAYATADRIAAAAPLVNRWHKKFVKRLLDPRPLSEPSWKTITPASAPKIFRSAIAPSSPRPSRSSRAGDGRNACSTLHPSPRERSERWGGWRREAAPGGGPFLFS